MPPVSAKDQTGGTSTGTPSSVTDGSLQTEYTATMTHTRSDQTPVTSGNETVRPYLSTVTAALDTESEVSYASSLKPQTSYGTSPFSILASTLSYEPSESQTSSIGSVSTTESSVHRSTRTDEKLSSQTHTSEITVSTLEPVTDTPGEWLDTINIVIFYSIIFLY